MWLNLRACATFGARSGGLRLRRGDELLDDHDFPTARAFQAADLGEAVRLRQSCMQAKGMLALRTGRALALAGFNEHHVTIQ